MDAIILAGGFGTRLQKIVSHVPKPLAPINGTPFLEILLDQLSHFAEIERVIFATGHLGNLIVSYFEDKTYPFTLHFSHETTPLGTGGAIKLAHQLVHSPHYFVLNGDSYFEIDFSSFYQHHLNYEAKLSIACRHVEDVSRYGEITFDEEHQIQQFHEKSTHVKPGWINGGIYCIDRSLPFPSEVAFSIEKDFFPTLESKGLFSYPCTGTFIDIGTQDSYTLAQDVFA